jgi:hypothetical protein
MRLLVALPCLFFGQSHTVEKIMGMTGVGLATMVKLKGSDLACGLCFASLLGVDKNQNSIQKHLA